jgi:hypothetical protein
MGDSGRAWQCARISLSESSASAFRRIEASRIEAQLARGTVHSTPPGRAGVTCLSPSPNRSRWSPTVLRLSSSRYYQATGHETGRWPQTRAAEPAAAAPGRAHRLCRTRTSAQAQADASQPAGRRSNCRLGHASAAVGAAAVVATECSTVTVTVEFKLTFGHLAYLSNHSG